MIKKEVIGLRQQYVPYALAACALGFISLFLPLVSMNGESVSILSAALTALSAAQAPVGVAVLLAAVVFTILSLALGVGQIANSQLLEVIQDRPDGMAYATLALVGQILEICAVPIFAFLLSEGARRTAGYRKYFLRVMGLALGCEIPYNLLMGNSVFGVGSLNPVFGAVMSLIMLYFFRTFPEKTVTHMTIKAVALLGTYLGSTFLGVAFGGVCVILTAVLWATRERQNLQLLFGCLTGVACVVFSPLYMFSPIAFLAIHFYGGERGYKNRWVNYLIYPAMLIIFWLVSGTLG